MKVLVTGANGFLSGHVIGQLLEHGCQVRAMIRKGAKTPALTGLDIDLFIGNITDKSDVYRAVKGCDFVVHVAADTSQSHRKVQDYFPVNVTATQYIIDAVRHERCKRLVYVSSANTMGFGSFENPGNEKNPVSPLFFKSGYALSKLKAQELVVDSVRKQQIDAIVVNPSFILGPMDFNPHSGRIFRMIVNKRVAFYPPGGKNFVDVRDAAQAIANALTRGKDGECYLLAGDNLTFRDFFRKIKFLNGQKTLLIPVPAFILKFFGFFGSLFHRLGINTELNYTNACILCKNNFFDNSKATRFLGLHCNGIDKTLADALEWMKGNDIVDDTSLDN